MLQPDEKDQAQGQQSPPCAACGGPNLNRWAVWGQSLCNACKNLWDEQAPPDDAWDHKYPEDEPRYAAKRNWTAQWAAKQLRKARAA
jgi:hypothetical protein